MENESACATCATRNTLNRIIEICESQSLSNEAKAAFAQFFDIIPIAPVRLTIANPDYFRVKQGLIELAEQGMFRIEIEGTRFHLFHPKPEAAGSEGIDHTDNTAASRVCKNP